MATKSSRMGILSYKNTWRVSSNQESGNGYSDILIEVGDSDTGIVVEVKYVDDEKLMGKACREALGQIDEKDYGQALVQDGIKNVIKYGIAFSLKSCKVMGENNI